MKYLLLDVSGTILYKPLLFDNLLKVLQEFGFEIEKKKLQYHHKLLSEVIKFPDRTDESFYEFFNSELLYSIGIVPNKELLQAIFKSCSYLPWEKYEDTNVLNEISIPMGILSNFNSTLEVKLQHFFGPIFKDIFVSEVIGLSKPSKDFFQYALNNLKINPKDIIYVGDSFKLDFNPANEIGFTTFVIDREGFYPKNENVISSFIELKNIINK
jgi:FMN phosphatase YigB (HAD superfamily)